MKKKLKKVDNIHLAFILAWPIIAAILSIVFKANFLFSTLIFMGIPSLYLSILNKKIVPRVLYFSLFVGLTLGFILDLLAMHNNIWNVQTMFGFRLFGVVGLEDLLWGFLYIYFVTIFYETFIDKHFSSKINNPRLKYLFLVIGTLLLTLVIVFLINPAILKIKYYYLKAGIIFVLVPLILFAAKFPNMLSKFLKLGAYFFFFTFVHEVTGVFLGHWEFLETYSYIGFIDIQGVFFPFEEFLFWIILGAMGFIAYYEYFDDDDK